MHYMLLIYREDAKLSALGEAGRSDLTGAFMAYVESLRTAGAYVAGDRLDLASTATTVRITEGKTQVLDGPYAETREQLGGYIMIDVPDLDAALSWAARCPGARFGTVEVRPILPVPGAVAGRG